MDLESLDFDIDLNFGLSQDVDDIVDSNALKVHNPNTDKDIEHKSLDHIVNNDIEIFTEFVDYLKTDLNNKAKINILEDYRVLERNILVNRGVFYSENLIEVFQMYDKLKKSSLLRVDNRSFSGRYMLPIKLIDGRVYTYLGYNYDPQGGDTKYEMPNQKWINQYNLIGNLESISLYPGNIVYVTEGYFDAVTLNSQWGVKSVCIFGSRLSLKQKTILNMIKGLGHVLIYVPDKDISGQPISKDKIWDFVWNFPTQPNDGVKDINDYVQSYYIRKYSAVKKVDLISRGKIDIPIYKPTEIELQIKLNNNKIMYKSYI